MVPDILDWKYNVSDPVNVWLLKLDVVQIHHYLALFYSITYIRRICRLANTHSKQISLQKL